MNIHNVMGDIVADILRPAWHRKCGICRENMAGIYATWYLPIDGQVTDGGGAYLCAECQNKLELSGAKIVYK